jgi:hypothetical protein
MLGGVGYASYKAGQRRQDQADSEAEQQAAPPEQAAPAPAASEAPADSGAQRVEALSRLKELLDGGALTQDEFDSEKQRILRGE